MINIFRWKFAFKIRSCPLYTPVICIFLLLTACAPSQVATPILDIIPSPTQTVSPTQTIEWFPATSTPTKVPTLPVTPTPEFLTDVGGVIFSDDFSNPDHWTLGQTQFGNIALGINELTIAIAEPKGYDFSVRDEPILSDFYLEITTSPTLCRDEDQYGILFRMSSPGDFYRYAVSCDGRVRLDRIVQGSASSPQPWINSSALPPGAPITSVLGVWARGNELRLFINDQLQFSLSDPLLPSGNLGLFARSMGDTAVTVNFSELVVWSLEQ
ncbi:MAG: hypothetical protein JSV42_09645 [Chloroflexota bacterium]|nr:MAG: hypothetical protein JSV42_09645 [Chloroflexota bacterium]